jgi:cytohesin
MLIQFFLARSGIAGLIGLALVLTVGQATATRAGNLDFFVEAVRENRIEEVRALIEQGIDVDSRDIFGDNTGLHWAAKLGLAEMARLLIDNDADLDIRNRQGDTPLHWAVGEGQKELVVILIVYGVDVNARGHGGWTPLRWAYRQRQDEIARILVAAGAH